MHKVEENEDESKRPSHNLERKKETQQSQFISPPVPRANAYD